LLSGCGEFLISGPGLRLLITGSKEEGSYRK